jgi:hypothetical protein
VSDAARFVNSWYNWILASSDDMDMPEGESADTSIRRLSEQRDAILSSIIPATKGGEARRPPPASKMPGASRAIAIKALKNSE